MKRTLMRRDQELLEFEVDLETGSARVIDASPAGVDLLASAGRAESDANEALGKLLRKRCITSLRRDFPRIPASYNARLGIELSLMGPVYLAFRGGSLCAREHCRAPWQGLLGQLAHACIQRGAYQRQPAARHRRRPGRPPRVWTHVRSGA